MRKLIAIAICAFLPLWANLVFAQEQAPKQLSKEACAEMVKSAGVKGADAFILISKNSGQPQLLACAGKLSGPMTKEKLSGHTPRFFSAKWMRVEVGSHCYWYEGDNNTLYKYCPQH